MLLFWMKWIAFFWPVPGWKRRLQEAKAGRNVWDVPGKPEKSKVVPWPVEWMPHRLELTEEDDETAHTRGFVFLPGVCVDTGLEAKVGEVVSCCRCRVALHPRAAHMIAGFDPPHCKRCRWVIKLVL